jgi:hypothetical protein
MSHIAQITKTQTSAKRRKKGILKKMQELNCSPLSSEPALLGWPYTEKGQERECCCGSGEGGPHRFSLSHPHLPHHHTSMRRREWTCVVPLLQRENKEEAMGRERKNSKDKRGKEKKETYFPFLDIVIRKLYCPYY